MNKAQIRSHLLATRRALPLEKTQAWDQQICTHIKGFIQQKGIQQVWGFMGLRGEVKFDTLWRDTLLGVIWGLPVAGPHESLTFYPWALGRPLNKSTLGVWEPKVQGVPLQALGPHTLILVPAVGIDFQGNRIGFGKGHYDRFLPEAHSQGCVIMGVVYDACLLHERIPLDPWDVPLPFICTQSGWRACHDRPNL